MRVAPGAAVTAGAGGQMVQDDQVRVLLEEKLNISMKSDGSIDIMEVKGTLAVICNDEACGKVQVQLSPDSIAQAGENGFQFKTNPNMSKNDFLKNSLLCLKNKKRDYPLQKPTTVLRWRFSSNDDSSIPFTINSWPEAGNGGNSSLVNNTATKGDDGEVDNSTGGHGTGGSNGFAIITNQGSAPSITGGGSFTGRTITSTNPT